MECVLQLTIVLTTPFCLSPGLLHSFTSSSWPQAAFELNVSVKSLSRVRLFATPWAVARQVPLSEEFFRQEYWSGLPFPSPGDLSYPGIEPRSSALQADSLLSKPPGKPVLNILSVC